METIIVYVSFAMSLGLSALVAALVPRYFEMQRQAMAPRVIAHEGPTEVDIIRLVEKVVKREMPTMLGATFESGKIAVKIERMLQDKLHSDATLAQHVKAACDQHYRQLVSFVEHEVIPTALERSGKIAALKL